MTSGFGRTMRNRLTPYQEQVIRDLYSGGKLEALYVNPSGKTGDGRFKYTMVNTTTHYPVRERTVKSLVIKGVIRYRRLGQYSYVLVLNNMVKWLLRPRKLLLEDIRGLQGETNG